MYLFAGTTKFTDAYLAGLRLLTDYQDSDTKGMTFVFCNAEGNPLSIQNITSRLWAPLLRNLNLPYRKIYQTRHTAASLWLAAGENVMWVSKVLGHADVHTTLTRYAAYSRDLTRQDGSAFEALLEQKMGKKL